MLITLEEWNKLNFSVRFGKNTLQRWASTGQIYPPAQKVAGRWMVDETAQYVPLSEIEDMPQLLENPRLRRIINGS